VAADDRVACRRLRGPAGIDVGEVFDAAPLAALSVAA
jgi:hypothetical protein